MRRAKPKSIRNRASADTSLFYLGNLRQVAYKLLYTKFLIDKKIIMISILVGSREMLLTGKAGFDSSPAGGRLTRVT